MNKKLLLTPIIMGAALVSCTTTEGSTILPNTSTTDTTTSQTGSEVAGLNIYAYEAATSVGLVNLLKAPQVMALQSDAPTGQTTADLIAQYLPTAEAVLLGEQNLFTETTVESDLPEYQTKVIVNYKDITLTDVSFTMYYNETIKHDHDDDWNDDDDWDDDWDEQDEIEQESYIDGIIQIGQDTFTLRGEKEMEEDELETSFRYFTDENTYVLVEQEIENDEQEFNYTVVKNGRKVYDYSLEAEDQEIEMEIRGTDVGMQKYKMQLFRKDGVTYIQVRSLNNGNRESYLFKKVIDQTTGLATFVLA